MSNGYLRFNFWRSPKDNEIRVYANAGIGKQKFNSFCLNASSLNKWGKMPAEAHLSAGMTRAFSAFWECLGVGKNTPARALELCEKCQAIDWSKENACVCDFCKNRGMQTEFLLSRAEVDALKHREDFVLAEIPCYAGKDYVITYFLITDIARCFHYSMESDGGYLAIITPLKRGNDELGSVFMLQFFSIDRFFQISL